MASRNLSILVSSGRTIKGKMCCKFVVLTAFFLDFTGFEEAIRAHFRLQREAVLKQCAEWLTECADSEEERRMRKAVDTLKSELDKL